MEGLIFIIPFLLIFLIFIIQIFLFFKKIFAHIFNSISEYNQEIADDSSYKDKDGYLYDQTLEMPEDEYIPITERDLDEINEVDNGKNTSKKESEVNAQKGMKGSEKSKKRKKIAKDLKKLKTKSRTSSASAFNFDNLNELEKAVILKEILDKPKALRKYN